MHFVYEFPTCNSYIFTGFLNTNTGSVQKLLGSREPPPNTLNPPLLDWPLREQKPVH
uniref:Uncharacterized protein n=1 Tax=Solanum tuberosum TaxID=4113 RepID=M1BDL1_SOLTU